jgi:glycosyltransferase involved in cell wall biosynthesis
MQSDVVAVGHKGLHRFKVEIHDMTVSTPIQNRATNASIAPMMQRRLRVLHVINSLGVGGAEQHLVVLARHIDTTRYDVRVCSLTPLLDTSISRNLHAAGVPIYSLDVPRLHDPRLVFRLAALVRRHNIDLIHTHLTYSNIIGGLAGTVTRRPVVTTLHNVRDIYPPFRRIKKMLPTQTLRWCSHTVIACAPEVRMAAREEFGLPPGRMIDLPYGIETEAYANVDPSSVLAVRRELLGESEGPLVLTVGNLRVAKAHEHLVSATRFLAERVPGTKVVIVGRNDTNESVVRERIAALGLEERVILAGQRADIAEILAAADLFVLSSTAEGLPLAMLEAMAAGKPVVATAVGGIPGVIEDDVTGRLVPPADIEALADAMMDLLCRPDKARRLAQAGRTRVQETYGADNFARHIQPIYSEVAGGKLAPATGIVD